MSKQNANRPGYKKTKVGWIPEEWELRPVKKFGKVITGNTPPKNDDRNYGSGTPWCTAVDMEKKYVKKTAIKLTDRGVKSARVLPSGTVLATCIASIGKNAISRVSLATNQQINAVIVNKLNNNEFFYYSVCFNKSRMLRYSGITAVPILNKSEFENMPFPSPPLSEQKKIAKILSTWDEAIEQTRKLIDAKKCRKKALMQQLLTGKKRTPGFATSKGRNSYRFFDLPEDWKCPQIRDVAQEYSERNSGRDDLTVLSCSKHLGFVESSEYFGKQVFSADTSNYKVIRRNYFGYPSNHIEEGSIGLLLSHDIGIVSPIYTVFQCNDSVIPEYLYAVFKTVTFKHIFAISTNASVDRRGSLRWREFSLIRVPLPSIKEQQAIVKVLNVSDREIAQLETKLKSLEKQKRGLMQKLLTGEVRVKL